MPSRRYAPSRRTGCPCSDTSATAICNLLPPGGLSLYALRAGVGERLTACVHDVAAALGGSFSAEHGVGALKVRELERYELPTALALMRTLKRALDPDGLMNPGKVLRAD